MTPIKHEPDPSLDLVLERVIDVPRELVWKAWTTPELMKQWFTPKPWQTTEVELDLRPGGIFRNKMKGPNEGEEFDGAGCILEVVEGSKLVWTSALGPGYRPQPGFDGADDGAFYFTAVITMEDYEGGTKYTALVVHADEKGKQKHEAMGFHGGWGAALDQLVELMKG
jgi:uncharacterized protein YndB with AHSA1/START domain